MQRSGYVMVVGWLVERRKGFFSSYHISVACVWAPNIISNH